MAEQKKPFQYLVSTYFNNLLLTYALADEEQFEKTIKPDHKYNCLRIMINNKACDEVKIQKVYSENEKDQIKINVIENFYILKENDVIKKCKEDYEKKDVQRSLDWWTARCYALLYPRNEIGTKQDLEKYNKWLEEKALEKQNLNSSVHNVNLDKIEDKKK